MWKHRPPQHKQWRTRMYGRSRRGMTPDRVSIHDHPPVVEERSRIGDFEADTIVGEGHRTGLVTLVDRTSQYLRVCRIDRISAEPILKAMVSLLHGHPVEAITSDNGKEFARHTWVASELKAAFYFADPYRASQRGTNEQTNGLIRRYFLRETDFSEVTDVEIQRLEHRFNNRTRKVLGWRTTWEVYSGKANPPLVAFQT